LAGFTANFLLLSLPSRWGYAWFISVICVNQWSDLSLLGFYPRLSAQISGKVLFFSVSPW
jgi:hypothetical protein